MTTSANTIAFNVGTPTIAGPNGGFINGVKFTGPTKTGKFWIAATSAQAKPGSTREPNSKEKGELLAAFKTAFVAVHEGVATPEGDAFIEVVAAANTPSAKPAGDSKAAGKAAETGAGDVAAAGAGDVAAAEASEAGDPAAAEAATGAATKGGDFSGDAAE